MDIKIPKALVEDHQEIHNELEKAIKEGGQVGATAEELMKVIAPHQEHEEKFALPPLGLLPALVGGQVDYDMAEASVMTDTLKAEMPRMRAEHKAILAAVGRLAEAARQEGKPEYVEFAEQMKLHVEEEEEVYYPAAELVGAFLKIKLALVFQSTFP
jgi:hemerythrin superfamily protein